jgi:hypothetical protein
MRGVLFIISAFLLQNEIPFNPIGLAGRHPANGIGGTKRCDGALVAIETKVVPDLQVQRAIAKGGAPLYTFGAANTELLVDDVLKIGLLDKPALDGCRRTELILGTRLQFGPGFKVTSAEITIATKGVGMNTLHGRICLYTFGGTTSALGTFEGIDLPHIIFSGN